MSAFVFSCRRLHRPSLAAWLAIAATLLPLFMPLLPGGHGFPEAQATVGADPFAWEICSVTRASPSDKGDRQVPAHHTDQHCPICRTVQQLGSCVVPETAVAIAIVWIPLEVSATDSRDVVSSSSTHGPAQPRAPPVRV